MNDATFIDSNVFIRHLLDDHPVMSPASRLLLLSVERRELAAWTTPTVISEIVWVLTGGVYRMDRTTVSDAVLPLSQLTGLTIDHRPVFPRAFGLFSTLPIDFEDAFHAALVESRGEKRLYSYDRDFDRIDGLERLEP